MSEPRSAKDRDVAALVDAAMHLFAERGPAATSLRQVAERAGVNYGLIHQYVGTKDDLLRLVIRQVSSTAAGRFATAESASVALADALSHPNDARPYLRMMARTMLDGSERELLDHSPGLTMLIQKLVKENPGALDEKEAAIRVLASMSLMMGWQLFHPYLQAAAGLGDHPAAEIGHRVLELSLVLLERGADASA